MLNWLVSTDAYKWIAGAVAAIIMLFFVRKSGKDEAKLEEIARNQKQDEAARKKVQEANEKIKSDPSFINRWLHDTKRFRD